MQDLLEIMRLLRSPDGCPWDREQTHRSIRGDFLEETHEAIEAIDREDLDGLQEELGDVLLQVVFHACIEEEKNGFTFHDVVDTLCQKLVMRHPHVFGNVDAADAGQALKNWDAIKRQTKKGKTQTQLLDGVPHSLPALMRAGKVLGRARRVGFETDGRDRIWAKGYGGSSLDRSWRSDSSDLIWAEPLDERVGRTRDLNSREWGRVGQLLARELQTISFLCFGPLDRVAIQRSRFSCC